MFPPTYATWLQGVPARASARDVDMSASSRTDIDDHKTLGGVALEQIEGKCPLAALVS